MPKTLVLIHTTPVTVQSLKELTVNELPGVRVVNLMDDSLLADVMSRWPGKPCRPAPALA